MSTKANSLPTGSPMLSIHDAAKAIEFYKRALGATELTRLEEPGGKVGHAELRIGNTTVTLADEYPEMEKMGWVRSPRGLGGSSVILHVYVDDVDAVTKAAAEAGAKVLSPPSDQFYGDRISRIADPFGHLWMLATRKEDLSPAEVRKRFEAILKQ
ncbi:MAG: VOC family protein [Candidatus Binataceae bacterium]